MSLAEIARFHDRHEAEVAVGFLRANDIQASLADDALAAVDPLMWRALGGLRVMAPASQLEAARTLLSDVKAGAFEIEGDEPEPPARGAGLTLTVLGATLALPEAGLAMRRAERPCGFLAGLGVILAAVLALVVIAGWLWSLADAF